MDSSPAAAGEGPAASDDAIAYASGTIKGDGANNTPSSTAVFTNTRRAGSLRIYKDLTNDIPDDVGDTFYFDVTLVDENDAHPRQASGLDVIQVNTQDVPTTAGTGDHPLWYEPSTGVLHNVPVRWTSNGASSTLIENIPVGTVCTVAEASTNHWSNSTYSSMAVAEIPRLTSEQSKTIAYNTHKDVTFTNVRQLGNIKIAKTVTSSPIATERNASYDVVVRLQTTAGQAALPDGSYTVETYASTDAQTYTSSRQVSFSKPDGSAAYIQATIPVPAGGYVLVKDVPTGVTYTITEANCSDFITTYAEIGTNGVVGATLSNATQVTSTEQESSKAASQSTSVTVDTTYNTQLSANQTVAITNTLVEVSPTGVALRFAPYILMAAAAVVLLVMASRRRKDTQDKSNSI